jgi:uncharacterized membrane protein HdeD (DUF308 family)
MEALMNELLRRSWWMLAVRGLLALLFGVLTLLWPGITLLGLIALFAAWLLISGAAGIAAAWNHRTRDRGWWLILLIGIVSVVAAVIAIANPDTTALVLVLLMGANAIVTGALDIAVAIRLRKTLRNEWLLGGVGVISILFGLMVFAYPGAGALALAWLIGIYAIAIGVLLLAAALHARSWSGKNAGGGYTPVA